MTERLTPEQKMLIEGWLSMAHGVAKNFWERSGKTLELAELISIAYQGLVQAAQRFEPNRPAFDENWDAYAGFGQFAKQRVTGAILDWQRSQDHVPRRQRATYKQFLANGHGAGRTPEELAPLVGMSPDKIRAIVSAVESSAVSLDDSWSDHGDPAEHAQASAVSETFSVAMVRMMNSLPIAQRTVISERYFYGAEVADIAAELGVSVATAQVLLDEALMVLRSVLRFASDT